MHTCTWVAMYHCIFVPIGKRKMDTGSSADENQIWQGTPGTYSYISMIVAPCTLVS